MRISVRREATSLQPTYEPYPVALNLVVRADLQETNGQEVRMVPALHWDWKPGLNQQESHGRAMRAEIFNRNGFSHSADLNARYFSFSLSKDSLSAHSTVTLAPRESTT